jgi:uncharacterized lipoprotein NlpE involved in copper resistance
MALPIGGNMYVPTSCPLKESTVNMVPLSVTTRIYFPHGEKSIFVTCVDGSPMNLETSRKVNSPYRRIRIHNVRESYLRKIARIKQMNLLITSDYPEH